MQPASRDGLMVVIQPRQPAKKFLGKVVKRCGRHGSQGDNQTGIRPSRDLFTGGHFVFCFRAFPRNGRCANIAGLFDRSLSAWAAPTRYPRSGQQTTGSRGSCSSSSGSKWTARSPNASPPASKLWPSSWSRRGGGRTPAAVNAATAPAPSQYGAPAAEESLNHKGRCSVLRALGIPSEAAKKEM